MAGKYKIVSSSNIVNMIVNFQDQNGNHDVVHVGLDYSMEKVFFLDHKEGIDYEELSKAILASVSPEDIEMPEISEDLLTKVREIKNGKFDNENIFNE